MKRFIIVLLLFTTALFAKSINIAVAANVSYAIDELKAEFKKMHPNTDVHVTLGSSGKLSAQIKNGAPYGLFMAANMKYPEALYASKIATTKPVVYAQGALAYFSAKKMDFSQGIKLLESKSIKKIALANPTTAPYGKAAVEAIKNGGLYENIKEKFVFAESISQTVSYAMIAADVGLIAKSSLYSSKMKHYKEGINWESVDTKLYLPIKQGIVLLKYGSLDAQYKAFYEFILSQKAKDIFAKYGYL